MALAPGTLLGRYEVRSLLGAGGMGEVYLAHDTQLRRPVALKVLPADLTENGKRLRRFEQEGDYPSEASKCTEADNQAAVRLSVRALRRLS